MARGVRRGCPAIGFLFFMTFDPFFRWLHDSIIQRKPAAPDFLQPSPSAHADDFAVGASSFWSLMAALSLSCFGCRSRGWAAPQSSEVLLGTVWQRQLPSTGCRQTVRNFAKWNLPSTSNTLALFGGQRWGSSSRELRKLNGTSKSLVERLMDFKMYVLSVLEYLGSMSALDGEPSRRRSMRCNAPLLVRTMLYPLTYNVLDLRAALVSTCLRSISSAFLLALERLPTRTHSPTALRRSVQLVNITVPPLEPLLPNGNSFWRYRWFTAEWKPMNLATWITEAKLPTLPAKRNKRPPRPCSAARSNYDQLLFTIRSFGWLLPKSGIRIFPTPAPQHVRMATIFKDGPFIQMEEVASLMVSTSAGWGAVARSPDGRLFIMFGPVVMTAAHLTHARARIQSNNSAELSSSNIEELSFLGPGGSVARDSQACILYDSRQVTSICLGTVQSRANVTLGSPASVSCRNPVKSTIYFAAYLQSCPERWEWVCGPWRFALQISRDSRLEGMIMIDDNARFVLTVPINYWILKAWWSVDWDTSCAPLLNLDSNRRWRYDRSLFASVSSNDVAIRSHSLLWSNVK